MNRALDLMTHDELERLPRDADGCFGSLATARGHLPLEAMDVHARAVGLDVRVELRQTFVNNLAQPIEATYIFPLPDRAAVNRFRLRVGERVIEGVIDERGQARQNYEEAIRAGHRAAIAEEERPDVFTVRVGNLMPGQRAEVQIDLVGALAVERNEATFRFPLVVAPRYIPGQPLSGESVGAGAASDTDAVPDASRITPPVLLPGYPNPVRLSLRVDVDPAGLPISRLRSSLHAVTDIPGEGGRRRIELAPRVPPSVDPDGLPAGPPKGPRAERLDRDFVLRYALGDGAVRTSLLLARDADGQMDSFALTLLPPEQGAAGERPRDVVLVLDRSGSMGGWKMVAARRAAARMVDSLCEQDRFAVLAFDDRIDAPAALPADALSVAADRNRFRAVEFLAGLEARGGTEMAAPLLRAAELLGGGYRDRERILVLVTDGQIGNEDQILRELAPRLRGARVFALGVDRAVNAGFLRRLADLGGGGAELVESEDRLDEVMERVHRRIGTPVVTEISLEGDGLEIEPGSISPRRLPDLMSGAPVVIRGRARGKGGGAIVLRGDRSRGAAVAGAGERADRRRRRVRRAVGARHDPRPRGPLRHRRRRGGRAGPPHRRPVDPLLGAVALHRVPRRRQVREGEPGRQAAPLGAAGRAGLGLGHARGRSGGGRGVGDARHVGRGSVAGGCARACPGAAQRDARAGGTGRRRLRTGQGRRLLARPGRLRESRAAAASASLAAARPGRGGCVATRGQEGAPPVDR